jgi:hypothetical protein
LGSDLLQSGRDGSHLRAPFLLGHKPYFINRYSRLGRQLILLRGLGLLVNDDLLHLILERNCSVKSLFNVAPLDAVAAGFVKLRRC